MNYEVIIVGGGPVGVALAIELGMLNIKTAVIEKYDKPQLLPRAQLLNPRSMEFFRRWGINQQLLKEGMLSASYPLKVIWCSGLAGKMYASVDMAEHIDADMSPEAYQRIPLFKTEEVLRERLAHFASVEFIRNSEVINLVQTDHDVTVTIEDKTKNQYSLTAKYVVGCDGANSITRQMIGVETQIELAAQRALSVLFQSQELKEKISLPEAVLYFNLSAEKTGGIGCVDDENGWWYSHVFYPGNTELNTVDVSAVLDQLAGFSFAKEVTQANYWIMQGQVAVNFREGRVFLAGDAAHALPPTGGHGLNTGFGDAVNLGWKLAAVLRDQAGDNVLDSYHAERKPVAIRNIKTAKKNAEDGRQARKTYPPEIMPEEFAKENARIANQHAVSPGIALGYCYIDSPIIMHADQPVYQDNPFVYQPTAEPGYFAPHCYVTPNKCLYDYLQPSYTLLVTENMAEDDLNLIVEPFLQKNVVLNILMLTSENIKKHYQKTFYLLRPDWHIAWCSDALPSCVEDLVNHFIGRRSVRNE